MKEEVLILNGEEGANNEYRVRCHCSNCGKSMLKDIPFGVTIEDRKPLCIYCGCQTLVIDKDSPAYG